MKYLTAAAVCVLGLAVTPVPSAAQRLYRPIKQTLTQAQKDGYLDAMRKAWIQVDDASDAKPVANCFAESISKATPLTAVPTLQDTEVVLRFVALRDDPQASTVPQTIVLSLLLLNDEIIWQGHVEPNERYAGPTDPSCQFAATLAGQLRDAIRRARAGSIAGSAVSSQAEADDARVLAENERFLRDQKERLDAGSWVIKDVEFGVTEANDVFIRFGWKVTIRNGLDRPQTFDLEMQFLNSRGLVIDTDRKYRETIRPFEELTITGADLVSMPAALRVSSAKAITTNRR